jgi:hypothetical protein
VGRIYEQVKARPMYVVGSITRAPTRGPAHGS